MEERGARGEQRDPAYEIRRKLGERFVTAAQLYAETVVVFTSSPFTVSRGDEYDQLREATEAARGLAEAIGIAFEAFEEHLESHRRQGEGFLLRSEMTKTQGRSGSSRFVRTGSTGSGKQPAPMRSIKQPDAAVIKD
jgi:hypothetical protein